MLIAHPGEGIACPLITAHLLLVESFPEAVSRLGAYEPDEVIVLLRKEREEAHGVPGEVLQVLRRLLDFREEAVQQLLLFLEIKRLYGIVVQIEGLPADEGALGKEVDFFGIVSDYRMPDKFSRTGLTARKSEFVDAPVIEECPLVVECELKGFVRSDDFGTILGSVVNIAADEGILDASGRIDVTKAGIIFYDSFSSSYFGLGGKVGRAFGDGRDLL